MLLAVYTFVIPAVLLAIASSGAQGPSINGIASVYGFMCGMCLVVHGGLRWLRAGGYTMTAPRRRYQ